MTKDAIAFTLKEPKSIGTERPPFFTTTIQHTAMNKRIRNSILIPFEKDISIPVAIAHSVSPNRRALQPIDDNGTFKFKHHCDRNPNKSKFPKSGRHDGFLIYSFPSNASQLFSNRS